MKKLEKKAVETTAKPQNDNLRPASIRTSFTLPKDWSDLEKLWLAFKVMDADNATNRTETGDDRDDIACNVWQALLQAVLIAPVKTQEDLLIKLEALDYNLTAHLLDNEGRIKYSEVNWLELEAHAINKQLTAVIEKHYIDDQRGKMDYLKERDEARAEQAKQMTEVDKVELARALNTVSSYNL